MTGPLHGVRVVELAGIGPGPFAAMLLADMGADVVRVDRVDPPSRDYTPNAVIERGRRSVAVDLRRPEGAAIVRRLASGADVLVESNRPGVLERLGLGPDVLLADNPRLGIGRLTGYGQDGPLAGAVGHDLNYISLTGALHTIGRAGEPAQPGRRLWWGWVGAGFRGRLRTVGGPRVGGRAGRRCQCAGVDSGLDGVGTRAARGRSLEPGSRGQPPGRGDALLRHLHLRGWPLGGGRDGRGEVLP